MTAREITATLERALESIPPEELPLLIGELARLQAEASVRLTSGAANGRRDRTPEAPDELLDVEEAARRLSLSCDHLYRHAKELPFTVRIGRRLRFSAKGIERYIRQRQGR
jgi:excisionase family DNA binding protein